LSAFTFPTIPFLFVALCVTALPVIIVVAVAVVAGAAWWLVLLVEVVV
jgi:hypothetical protein